MYTFPIEALKQRRGEKKSIYSSVLKTFLVVKSLNLRSYVIALYISFLFLLLRRNDCWLLTQLGRGSTTDTSFRGENATRHADTIQQLTLLVSSKQSFIALIHSLIRRFTRQPPPAPRPRRQSSRRHRNTAAPSWRSDLFGQKTSASSSLLTGFGHGSTYPRPRRARRHRPRAASPIRSSQTARAGRRTTS